jgi:hypothetical protein
MGYLKIHSQRRKKENRMNRNEDSWDSIKKQLLKLLGFRRNLRMPMV